MPLPVQATQRGGVEDHPGREGHGSQSGDTRSIEEGPMPWSQLSPMEGASESPGSANQSRFPSRGDAADLA
jgi:hypothetical protein